jgi:hypothetical protein
MAISRRLNMDLRERIRRAEDIPSRLTEVPEWGVTVMLRGINGTERGEWDKKVRKASEGESNFLQDFVWPLLQLTICDPETGKRLYAATDADRDELLARRDTVLYRLFVEAQALCGLGTEAREEAKKDFAGTP